MKKTLLSYFVLGLLLFSASALAVSGDLYVAKTGNDGTGDGTSGNPWLTINYAITQASASDIIHVAAGTYNENVAVNKAITLSGVGATTIITPSSGIGINASVNGVTITDLRVTGATDHGIYVGSPINGVTLTNITADANGTGVVKRSGIALQGVTGTSVLTNITASGNGKHGLEIGNGSTGVSVTGGTFNGNGTIDDIQTGAGIIVYADAGNTTNGTLINGVTANTNKTAGIYLYCATGGTLSGTIIGGTSAPTLNDNGSTNATYGTGGAAVLVFGPCASTTITANSINGGTVNPTAGLVVLGTDENGKDSPTGTVATGCNLSGFTTSSPAATMKAVSSGGITRRCTTNVTASGSPYNIINAIGTGAISLPADGYTVENLIVHKMDDILLGRFLAPGSTIYVTQLSGSIQRGIASSTGYTTVQVQAGAAYAENVTIDKAITLSGDGVTTIVTPASGIGINVTTNGVTISALKVANCTFHGIWADNVTNLNITNVTVDGNGTAAGNSTTGSGISLRNISGTSAVTGVTATNNKNHGLEIGDNCVGVTVNGGTYSNNGLAGYTATGGGILIYSNSVTVSGTIIKGTLTASNNATAGIYINSTPGLVTGTSIGQTVGDVITVSDNGSTGTDGTGGAGVLLYGTATSTTLSAAFSRTSVVGSGLVVLGINGAGVSSPVGTIVNNSTFKGYGAAPSQAITLASGTMPGAAKICSTAVTASSNVKFTGAITAAAIELLIYHQVDDAALGLVTFSSPILVKVKVFLQGAYSAGVMTTSLNSLGYIPLNSNTAYNGTTYGYTPITVGAIPNANVTDWMLVELRTGTAAGTKVVTQPAFILKDGSIVDADGVSDVAFYTAPAGDYYIVLRHRNHLAIMTAALVTLSNTGTLYDFTTAITQSYLSGTKDLGSGVFGMYGGDVNRNGVTRFNGASNDKIAVFSGVGGSVVSGYKDEDVNMNGVARFNGASNDKIAVYTFVGGTVQSTKVP